MSEPQVRSTLGTRWRTSGAPLPTVPVRPLASRVSSTASRLVGALLAVAIFTNALTAQIRGRAPESAGTSRWWFSGGAAATTSLTDINDGASRSVWRFGSDPLWQMRGSLERTSDDFTSLGIAVAYGRVDLTVTPQPGTVAQPAATPLPASCTFGCPAQAQMWSLMGQFRSGGGTGFHTLFEATGGVTGFRDMRTRDSLSLAIGKPSGTMDLSGAIGAGFGYPISRGLVIALVQDFGMGFHSKADLPSGTSRTWRIRTTRASLRFSF